jgi:uncharacterized protein with HEPN domain
MKPGRTLQIYFDDILDSILLIENYIEGISKNEFELNEEKQDAVIRRLEIIGEAIEHIPEDVREKYPDIPWKQIAGLRDVVIHEYFGVSISRIWNVLINDLSKLKETIIILINNPA